MAGSILSIFLYQVQRGCSGFFVDRLQSDPLDSDSNRTINCDGSLTTGVDSTNISIHKTRL